VLAQGRNAKVGLHSFLYIVISLLLLVMLKTMSLKFECVCVKEINCSYCMLCVPFGR